MENFWLCFVPLFVSVDAIGVLPYFITLTEGFDPAVVRRVVIQSVITATAVTLIFLLFGQTLLTFMGITVEDFMIAGGVLLLVLSLTDILTGEKKRRQPSSESLGVVPLGVPLLSGPALITTAILMANTHGESLAALAVVLNLLLAGVILIFSGPLAALLGRTGTRALSRICSLLLTAFAVMLIRKGIIGIIATQ